MLDEALVVEEALRTATPCVYGFIVLSNETTSIIGPLGHVPIMSMP